MSDKVIIPDNMERKNVVTQVNVKLTNGDSYNVKLDKMVTDILLAPDHVRIVRADDEITILPMAHIVSLKFKTAEKIVPKIVVPDEVNTEDKASDKKPSA